MRLLVLDGSRVMVNLVRRLVPQEIEIDSVASFDEAIDELQYHAPDAVIVDVTHAKLPWMRFQDLCHQHNPPIPVLYESSTCSTPEEAGITDLNGICSFLAKPYSAADLRSALQSLLQRVERHQRLRLRSFH